MFRPASTGLDHALVACGLTQILAELSGSSRRRPVRDQDLLKQVETSLIPFQTRSTCMKCQFMPLGNANVVTYNDTCSHPLVDDLDFKNEHDIAWSMLNGIFRNI